MNPKNQKKKREVISLPEGHHGGKNIKENKRPI
jgi:hypothetical protein